MVKNKTIIIVFLFLFVGCKYEDGPLFSVFSPSTRVIGDYTIEYSTKNGIDQMSIVNSLNIASLHFHSKEDLTPGGFSFSVSFSDTTNFNDSNWTLLNNDNDLYVGTLGCYSTAAVPPPFVSVPGFISDGNCDSSPLPIWEIIKLSQNKLWLKINFLDNNYEVHLKKM